MGSAHARAQVHDIEIAARRDGTMLAVRDRIWVDLGAYNSWGIVLPYNTVAHLLGPHRVANLDVECLGVVTNKTPNAPYRGAGRPETVFAMDRIVDCLARELAHGPGRAAPAQLPVARPICRTSCGSRIATATRSSTTAATSRPALEAALAGGRLRRPARGAGAAARAGASIAASGSRATSRAPRSGRTRARRCGSTPRATRWSPPAPAARGRGTRPRSPRSRPTRSASRSSAVTIVGGDTAAIPFGVGTFASRSAVNAGSSIHEASGRVKDKLVAAAAALLEAAPGRHRGGGRRSCRCAGCRARRSRSAA